MVLETVVNASGLRYWKAHRQSDTYSSDHNWRFVVDEDEVLVAELPEHIQLSNKLINGLSTETLTSVFFQGNLSKDMDLPRGMPNIEPGTAHPMPTFNMVSIIKTVVLSLIFTVSVIGNISTLAKMIKIRRRKSTINTLILHLAIADLIVTFFCIITDAIWASTVEWFAGNVMCKIIKFMQVFGLYASTYMIVIISLDRCMAIMDPLSRNKAPKRVRIMILAAWFLSALFSLPQAFIFRVRRGPWEDDFYQCVTFGAYSAQWQEHLYSGLTVMLLFVMPLATVITTYTLIFYTIARQAKETQYDAQEMTVTNSCCSNSILEGLRHQERLSDTDSQKTDMSDLSTSEMLRGPIRNQLFKKAKIKSLRMTAVIVLAFILCWTPYYVVLITWTYFKPQLPHSPHFFIWIFFFGMSNSMINPLIYGAFHFCSRNNSRRLVTVKTLTFDKLKHTSSKRKSQTSKLPMLA
ncbi:unnamed protein product [Owenia fusiformis]|uniref:Uncharacterized protein n=1 Tax=Owenia fusiformis TaxID=6347 RepID=A0A8J1TY67_OWEFU|nr:unnamed protein product [Owenia fusiformis]